MMLQTGAASRSVDVYAHTYRTGSVFPLRRCSFREGIHVLPQAVKGSIFYICEVSKSQVQYRNKQN